MNLQSSNDKTGPWWRNHSALMLLCCLIPVALVTAIFAFGIRSPWVYWLAILLCPALHYIMMKTMHKEGKCH